MTRLELMANIENIPLNIKRSRWALKHFFVILATAISGMPMLESLTGTVEVNTLAQTSLQRFNQAVGTQPSN